MTMRLVQINVSLGNTIEVKKRYAYLFVISCYALRDVATISRLSTFGRNVRCFGTLRPCLPESQAMLL